jgi:uncharacterized protein
MNKKALLIFARNPVSENIKTRLTLDLGKDKALEIYNSLLEITHESTKNLPFPIIIYWTESIPVLQIFQGNNYIHKIQTHGNLGEILNFALKQEFQSFKSICIMGSDCPELSEEKIKKAFLILESTDIVIGPSLDGGYYLLGMNQYFAELFENIQWSTNTVFSKTIEIINNLKLRNVVLEKLSDVDYATDYYTLQKKNIIK